MLKQVSWFVSTVAFLLNFFVYFYPDLVNLPGQCYWRHSLVETRWPWLDKVPGVHTLALNFPSLQAAKTAPTDPASGAVTSINMLTFGDPQINGNWKSTPYIKRLDNYGNDYFLGHIYRTMQRRLRPSHVAVMGDQFLSQWIYDLEFYNRTRRFVERLFPRDPLYKQTALDVWARHQDNDWVTWLNDEQAMDPAHRFQSRLYHDVYDWVHMGRPGPNFDNPLFINLTGNHDIGYSGDATWQHMARFHRLFGQNNYVINYNEGTPEAWRLVVLDSLTLEGPALQPEFLNYTWLFLDHLRQENANFHGSTVLLTHIPFYKAAGLCADGPEHIYYDETYEREPFKIGMLRSQNHLAYNTTQRVLDTVFPNPDKEGIILTGHDHVGCNTWYHHRAGEWVAAAEKGPLDRSHIREVVVRAMMGEFGGQTGLMSGHYNSTAGAWDFDFTYCSFVIQHVWWASKVLMLLAVFLLLAVYIAESGGSS